MSMKADDWVEVRSKEEILRTLDRNGRLDDLPFMPQMFGYCGQRFRVYQRAHKTCDTVNGTGGRRLAGGIHLDLRCDGQAYGGCQAACLIFWKEAWLRPATDAANMGNSPERGPSLPSFAATRGAGCTVADVQKGTRLQGQLAGAGTRYACQATDLPKYTAFLPWWDVRQYWEDFSSRNASLGRILAGFIYVGYHQFAMKQSLGRPLRWFFDRFHKLWDGIPYPSEAGTVPNGQLTPACSLNLQPGDLVRVKSYAEILATLDANLKNRGMAFDPEMMPSCGRTFRVKARVGKLVDEKTGVLKLMKTPAVILEGVWCKSRYSPCRMFCPRSIYSWWRESWLERVSGAADNLVNSDAPASADRYRERDVVSCEALQ